MQDWMTTLPTIIGNITPEMVVLAFTTLGALTQTFLEKRKSKRLLAITAVQPSDSAYALAEKAMDQIANAAKATTLKYEEMCEQYRSLEDKYHGTIELIHRQSQELVKLQLENHYLQVELGVDYETMELDDEDADPGFER